MYYITAVVDRLEHGKIVLRFEDGQELVLPKRKLPPRIKEGSMIHCEFFRDEDAEKRRESVAQYLLEEMLRPHDQTNQEE